MRWLELQIVAPVESHEAIAEICRAAGSPGARLEEDRVIAYLPVTDELDARERQLKEHLSRLPDWQLPAVQAVHEQIVDDSEWAESWKRTFGVQRVGRRVVIKPSWEDYTGVADEVVIALDPGMAFGTGQHPSTQLCIEMMEELNPCGMVVVDVGTGSGILAIAAAKLGASSVWAGDNDPLAVLVAQRNVARNRVERVVSVHLAHGCEGAPPCDLLVANLTAEVIESLLPDFTRCVQHKGWLVLSGIVSERRQRIGAALSRSPWLPVQCRERDDWCAFAAQKE